MQLNMNVDAVSELGRVVFQGQLQTTMRPKVGSLAASHLHLLSYDPPLTAYTATTTIQGDERARKRDGDARCWTVQTASWYVLYRVFRLQLPL